KSKFKILAEKFKDFHKKKFPSYEYKSKSRSTKPRIRFDVKTSENFQPPTFIETPQLLSNYSLNLENPISDQVIYPPQQQSSPKNSYSYLLDNQESQFPSLLLPSIAVNLPGSDYLDYSSYSYDQNSSLFYSGFNVERENNLLSA